MEIHMIMNVMDLMEMWLKKYKIEIISIIRIEYYKSMRRKIVLSQSIEIENWEKDDEPLYNSDHLFLYNISSNFFIVVMGH